MRTLVLIDAFNLYYSVKGHSPRKRPRAYLWLDLKAFCLRAIERVGFNCSETNIYYFTALPNHMAGIDPGKVARHQTFIKAQTSRGVIVCKQGFVTQKGNTYAKVNGREERSWKEKGTDVALTSRLFEEAIRNSFDQAVIVSNDSDYEPAIMTFRRLFPDKPLAVAATPVGARDNGNRSLLKLAAKHYVVQTSDYAECQLEDVVRISKHSTLQRPALWR